MKTAMIIFTICVCGFGVVLSVKRAIESYEISDWWGVLAQTIVFTASVAFFILVMGLINSIYP